MKMKHNKIKIHFLDMAFQKSKICSYSSFLEDVNIFGLTQENEITINCLDYSPLVIVISIYIAFYIV